MAPFHKAGIWTCVAPMAINMSGMLWPASLVCWLSWLAIWQGQAYPAVTKNIHPWIGTLMRWNRWNHMKPSFGFMWPFYKFCMFCWACQKVSSISPGPVPMSSMFISSPRDSESPGVADVSLRCWTARNAPRRTSIAELQALGTKQGDWRSWTKSTFFTPHKWMVS